MSNKLPNGWKECKLEEVAKIVGGGTPKTDVDEYWNGDIPWITPKDLSNFNGRYISKGERNISEKGLVNSSAKLLPPGTILLTSRAPVGYLAIAENEITTNQGFRSLVPLNNIDNIFLFYLLKNNIEYLKSQATGTTFGELAGSVLKSLVFLFPPLPEQRAIASVLSSLDDKIDLLHRENKTLEAMAETLFRQWFIEEAKDEWEEVPLSFLGDIVCGKTPPTKRKEYFGGNIPFIKIPDMRGNAFVFQTSDTLTEEGEQSQNNKTLPPKSICVSCIATVGLVSMTAKESQTNQQINSIVPKKDFYRYYLYLFMKNSVDLLIAMASGGTATLNLNTGDFSKIEVTLPNEYELKKFHKTVEPMFDRIYLNQTQIRTLEKLRDTLLPKLMSGEVRVKYEEEEMASCRA